MKLWSKIKGFALSFPYLTTTLVLLVLGLMGLHSIVLGSLALIGILILIGIGFFVVKNWKEGFIGDAILFGLGGLAFTVLTIYLLFTYVW